MSSAKVGVGVIGLGGIGAVHCVLVNANPGSRLLGVADADSRLIKLASKTLGSDRCFSEYDDLLDLDEISLVYICTPPSSHHEVLKAALGHTNIRSVLVEKPLAPTLQVAMDMTKLAEERLRPGAVGFQKRFNPVFRRVKTILQNGLLGEVAYVRASTFTRGTLSAATGWRGLPEGGGVLLDWGIHLIDLMCWFFDVPSVEAASRVTHFSEEVEDYATASLRFPHGHVGTLEVGWSARNYRRPRIEVEIHGVKGSLRCTEHELATWRDRIPRANKPEVDSEHCYAPSLEYPVPFLYGPVDVAHQDDALVKACQDGNWTGGTFLDACNAAKVVEEIRRFPLTGISKHGHET